MQRLRRLLQRRLAGRQRHAGGRTCGERRPDVAADACSDRVALARRLEAVAQGRRIEQHREFLHGDRRCLRAGLQQRLELDGRALHRLQVAGGLHVDVGEPRGDDVPGGHRALVQAENPEVLNRGLALARRHRQRAGPVADDLARIELHAPGRQQRPELRGLVGRHGGHGVLRVGARLIGLGQRIHERDDVAAAQRVLVDRELRRGRQVLRMHQDEHGHVRVDLGRVGLQRTDIEELLCLRVGDPGLAHLARLLVEARRHGEAGQPREHRLLRVGQLVDELDDVVLEELLLGGVEELDGLVPVGGVGSGESEVQVAGGADRRPAHAQLGGAVLVFGRGLRIDDVQAHLAVGARRQLVQEFPHPHAIGADLGNLACRLLRVEEIEIDGLLDVAEDSVGSRSRRVQMILREVEPPAAQRVAEQHREAHEEQGERDERAAAECRAFRHAQQLLGSNRLCGRRARSTWRAGRIRSASRSTADRGCR